jgi:hypothetical protein
MSEEKDIETVLHQTIKFKLDEIGSGVIDREDGERDFIQTEFDVAVDDFLANITAEGEYEVIGAPMISINSGYMVALITYASVTYMDELRKKQEQEMERKRLTSLS